MDDCISKLHDTCIKGLKVVRNLIAAYFFDETIQFIWCKFIFEQLEENEDETLSKRDSPHLETDSSSEPIRLFDWFFNKLVSFISVQTFSKKVSKFSDKKTEFVRLEPTVLDLKMAVKLDCLFPYYLEISSHGNILNSIVLPGWLILNGSKNLNLSKV